MLWMVLFMSLAVLVAAAVIVYVAYPHRGEDVPYVPAIGDAMKQAAGAIPVLDEEDVTQVRALRK